MTRVMPPETALARFCLEYYGTIKTASEILEIPYQTLCNNCRRPRRGWVHVDKMVGQFRLQGKRAFVHGLDFWNFAFFGPLEKLGAKIYARRRRRSSRG